MINADELKRLPFGALEVTFWNGTPAIAEVGTGRVVICNAMTANQETRRLQGIIADEDGLALLAGFVAAVNALPELLAMAEENGRMREALKSVNGWISNWQIDVTHGLKPTADSLVHAATEIKTALKRTAI